MRVAILMAAHNEADNIGASLASCKGTDTFVIDDNSTDKTAKIAKKYTPHVISVSRGGKGRAIRTLIEHYDICENYDAFILLDADSSLELNAVSNFTKALVPGVAGATGNMRNRQHSLFALWRSVQYFQAAWLYRRGMAAMNCIHVMGGTCSIWSTELFKQLDWHDSPVEDMDWTYQLHRKKLGKVTYAKDAYVNTLEPTTLKDYCKQMLRWFRGYWLTNHRYNAPFGGQSLDLGQAILLFEFCLNWSRLILIPLTLVLPFILRVSLEFSFLYDAGIIIGFAAVYGMVVKRYRILFFLPLYPLMFVLDTLLNMYSLLTYRKLTAGLWTSPVRRKEIVT